MIDLERTTAAPRVESFAQVFLEGVAGVTDLWLVRHGEAEPSRASEGGGVYDPPLTRLGQRQAQRLALRLRAEGGVDRLYSSPLRRARQTAEAVALELDLPVIEVFDLREVEWRPISLTAGGGRAARTALDEARAVFQRSGRWDSFPWCEASASLRSRVRRAIDGICSANAGRRLAVFCHGGVINAYLADLYGTERDMLLLPRNTSINALRILGEMHFIDCLNDAQHLVGIAEDDEDLHPTGWI
jgi:probable phosphoglycerate mutase